MRARAIIIACHIGPGLIVITDFHVGCINILAVEFIWLEFSILRPFSCLGCIVCADPHGKAIKSGGKVSMDSEQQLKNKGKRLLMT